MESGCLSHRGPGSPVPPASPVVPSICPSLWTLRSPRKLIQGPSQLETCKVLPDLKAGGEEEKQFRRRCNEGHHTRARETSFRGPADVDRERVRAVEPGTQCEPASSFLWGLQTVLEEDKGR